MVGLSRYCPKGLGRSTFVSGAVGESLNSSGFKTSEMTESLCHDQNVFIAISDGVVTETSCENISAIKAPHGRKEYSIKDRYNESLEFIADCLEIDGNKLRPETKLMDLGIDSISSATLASSINKQYKMQLSIAELITSKTIADLLTKINITAEVVT